MTKVIQSTIAERQSEAASVPLNFESKVYRQRTGLFDTGVTTALATLTPYTPLSFEGAATAERAGTIATASIPCVAGLTHGSGEKIKFMGPQIAYRADDFRVGGKTGVGMPGTDARDRFGVDQPKKPDKGKYRKRKGEQDSDVDARYTEDRANWEAKSILPGTYYRAYKEGLMDWLLGIDPIVSRNQWTNKAGFNKLRLDYWDKTVPMVSSDNDAHVKDSWAT